MDGDDLELGCSKNKELLSKYFNTWSEIKKSKKNTQNLSDAKNKQICEFLERLMQEKEKLTKKTERIKREILKEADSDIVLDSNLNTKSSYATAFGNYQHRFQAQKQIIALQKAKLDEQRRFIEELKLNKIVQDAESTTHLITNVRNSLNQCSNSVKPRLKYIIGDTNSSETSSSDTLKISSTKIPKFYQQMEERARQREEKRAVVRERKRQMELERERIKEQMAMERQILDQDEKERRLNEYKEKRRLAQLIAIRRKEEREKIRSLMVMADLHYEKQLIFRYGVKRWMMFVQNIKDDHVKAERFDKIRIIRYHFVHWREKVRLDVNEKNNRADELYHTTLEMRVFYVFKMLHVEMIHKMQTAEDWYDIWITNKTLARWVDISRSMKKKRQKQWEIATLHHECQLKWKVIGFWQTLPTIMALERKQEARKQRWRVKVQEILPDYIPKIED